MTTLHHMPASCVLQLLIARALTGICSLFVLLGCESRELYSQQLVDFNIGGGIIAKRSSIVVEGWDSGERIDEGIVVSCTRIADSRLGISGVKTGWVDADDYLPLPVAELEWQERVRHNPSAKNIAVLAYIQVLFGEEKAAEETIKLIGDSVQSDPYIRTVQAVVAARDPVRGRKLILQLCNDHVLHPELAAMLAGRLLNDAISKELAKIVIESCKNDARERNVELLLCRADIHNFPDKTCQAEEDAQKAIQIDPYYGDGRRIFASILEGNGNRTKAIQTLEEGIKLCPDDLKNYEYLAFLEIESGRAEKGLDTLAKIAGNEPNEGAKSFKIGTTLLNRLRMQPSDPRTILPPAVAQLRNACELSNYQRNDYVQALCTAYIEMDRADDAKKLIAKIIADLPRYHKRRIELEQFADRVE